MGHLAPGGPVGPVVFLCRLGPLVLLVPWAPLGLLVPWVCWPFGPIDPLAFGPIGPFGSVDPLALGPLGPFHWAMGPHRDHSKSAKVLVDSFRQGVEKTFYNASCDLVAALKHTQSPNAFKCKRNVHRSKKSGL